MLYSKRSLCCIRQRLGIRLRVDDASEREAQEEYAELILIVEDQIRDIEGYSRRL
jgi:hypothetical protein